MTGPEDDPADDKPADDEWDEIQKRDDDTADYIPPTGEES